MKKFELFDVLVCPLTHESLIYCSEKQELVSKMARVAYPIRDGIPVMLPDEARKLEENEFTILENCSTKANVESNKSDKDYLS